MPRLWIMIVFALWSASCANAQKDSETTDELVGGRCEGCEAVFEFGDQELKNTVTLPDFSEPGVKIKVMGTIYQSDGVTPAEGVILYVYHTDQNGIYATLGGEKGWGKRHGYIRGWMRTGKSGQYAFYTLRPGSYPNRSEPIHIHPTILEPNGKYYWLHGLLFEEDPLLTKEKRQRVAVRGGGTGVLVLRREGDLLVGVRDIVLGANISGYD